MKNLKRYGLLVLLVVLVGACGNSDPTAKVTNTPATPDFNQFLTILNEFRAQPQVCKDGTDNVNMPAVGPVTYNDQLNTSARLHSEFMAATRNLDHTGENGSSFSQRNTAAGYTGTSLGENIAMGSADVQGTFNQWRNSTAGHCQGMMDADATEIGLGYGFNPEKQWYHYWTLVTGKK